jgi:large subunit ribosomal protein L6
MSRVGKKPIIIPSGVQVTLEKNIINISGNKGKISQNIQNSLEVLIENNLVIISRLNESKTTKAYHGLIRALLQNMVIGVNQSFSKLLIAEGVGYKFQLEKNEIILTMGFSHPVKFIIPENLTLKVESPTRLLISGIDKEQVGFFAAKIRDIKPPEPYKGKGIRYENEKILRKAGKTRK